MKIAVIGIGYIGLPFACLLANAGFDVVGTTLGDTKSINKGDPPFDEPGVKELLKKVIKKKKFNATNDISKATADADVVAICVPTPVKNKKMDVKPLRDVVNQIKLKKGALVIVESTVYPGASIKEVGKPLERKNNLKLGKDFGLVYCPERAFPSKTLHEMVYNSRIIGGTNKKSTEVAFKIYSKFVKGKIYKTNIITAEMVKVSENAYRDVNIALANELALLSEQLKISVYDVISLANHHPRVNLHQPGPGVGGHCIPLDPWFIAQVYKQSKMIPVSRFINDNMPKHVVELVKIGLKKQKKEIYGSKIVLFGVSYKKDVDDVRETPAEQIVEILKKNGGNVIAYDPLVKKCSFVELRSLEEAVRNADCIIVVTDHSHFKHIKWREIGKLMRSKLLVDCRNLFKKSPSNFLYIGLGKSY